RRRQMGTDPVSTPVPRRTLWAVAVSTDALSSLRPICFVWLVVSFRMFRARTGCCKVRCQHKPDSFKHALNVRVKGLCSFGQGGIRTLMGSRPADFKSAVSTVPPLARGIPVPEPIQHENGITEDGGRSSKRTRGSGVRAFRRSGRREGVANRHGGSKPD